MVVADRVCSSWFSSVLILSIMPLIRGLGFLGRAFMATRAQEAAALTRMSRTSLAALESRMAVAATSRATVQIIERFHEAPLAYTLSAVSAVIYGVATVMLAGRGRTSYRFAVTACMTELVGVLAIGTASLVDPAAFPDATVWSWYGRGYLFIPLFLPVLGLLWLPTPFPLQPSSIQMTDVHGNVRSPDIA